MRPKLSVANTFAVAVLREEEIVVMEVRKEGRSKSRRGNTAEMPEGNETA